MINAPVEIGLSPSTAHEIFCMHAKKKEGKLFASRRNQGPGKAQNIKGHCRAHTRAPSRSHQPTTGGAGPTSGVASSFSTSFGIGVALGFPSFLPSPLERQGNQQTQKRAEGEEHEHEHERCGGRKASGAVRGFQG